MKENAHLLVQSYGNQIIRNDDVETADTCIRSKPVRWAVLIEVKARCRVALLPPLALDDVPNLIRSYLSHGSEVQ